MKAAVLNQTGDDKVELCDDVSTVDPGPGEVCIRVRACRICHSDLSAMNGTLAARAPGIVGHGRHPLARVGHDLDLTQRAGLPSGVGKLPRELREQSAGLVAQTRPGHTIRSGPPMSLRCGRCRPCSG